VSEDRPRPDIPLRVRLIVALRQLGRDAETVDLVVAIATEQRILGDELKAALERLKKQLGAFELELHHRPALINRPYNPRTREYTPPANDCDCLIYLDERDHFIETHVRGFGALRPDIMERAHQRRMAENRGERPRRPKAKIQSRGFPKQYRPLRSRPFQRAP